jgi:hypothetical protein
MYNTSNMISLLCLPRTAYFSYYQLGVYMKHRDFLEARTQTLNEIISYLVLSYANTFQKIIDVKAVKNAASFTRTGSPTAAARKRLSQKEIKICFQWSHKKKIELGIQPRRPRRYSSKKPQPVDVDVSLGLLLFTPKLTDNETRLTHFPPADDRSTCPSNSSVRYKHSVQCSRLYSFGPPHLSLSAFYTQICNSSHDRTDPTGFTSSGIIYHHPLLVA